MFITFKSAWRQFTRHLFSAKNCTSQATYNYVMVPIVILYIILTAIAFACLLTMSEDMIITGAILLGVDVLYVILIDIFAFCLAARRNHDIGLSKWFALIIFIPHIHFLYLIGLMFVPGNSTKRQRYLNN